MAGTVKFLNGRRFSHSSLEITILKQLTSGLTRSELFIDIDSIDYGDHIDLVLVRGTNRGPIGITSGDYEADDCNISMGKSTAQIGIVQAIGNGWMGTDIQITVNYNAPGEPLCTDVVNGVLAGFADSSKLGPDPTKAVLKIVAKWVSRNGVFPLANMIT